MMNRYVVSAVLYCNDGNNRMEVRTVFAASDNMAAECIRTLYAESDVTLIGIIIREAPV